MTELSKYTSVNLASLGLANAGTLMVKFALASGGGNNLYLDDVQLSTTLDEGELVAPQMWVQPNPSSSDAVLVGAEGAVQVVDLSGRVLWAGKSNGEAVSLPSLPAGTYVVHTAAGSLRWCVL